LNAILADFAARDVTVPVTAEDLRLALVLVDQIRLAPRFDRYLPLSGDALLAPVLRALQANPGDRRSLAEWARTMETTERTLSRRCQEKLGISFNEWRQRMKLVAALALLDAGEPVQQIALKLGYANASAFIAMFHRLTGTSPMQMRRQG
jgi:AraC-like DNA-binding protein